MLDLNEIEQVRKEILAEMAEVEAAARRAGSYNYLCMFRGELTYAHHPIGMVIRQIRPEGAPLT